MDQNKDKFSHELYKHVDQKDADGIAWAFLDKKDKLTFFPYKFPNLPDDEIRIKVTYAGLCFSDVHWCRGHWGDQLYPIAPGHEIMGIVTQTGKNVTRFKVGDKACVGAQRQCCKSCKICKMGEESYCPSIAPYDKYTYGRYWGGYSTHAQQPENFAFHVPDGMNEKTCAPLLCAGTTVWAPIDKYGKPGMKTAVIGIGGLGHLAVQILAKKGYEVAAVTTSMSKKDYILGLGATKVIDSTNPEDLKNNDSQYDLIINCLSGSGDFGIIFGLASVFATVAQCGLPDVTDNLKLTNTLVPKGISVVGVALGSCKQIEEMLEFCAKHNIQPKCEEFDFLECQKAFDHLENGKPNFRCVLNVKDYSEKNGYFK